ncbi:MAG: hypothetical protein L0Y66_01690 [Myxococcaceae bacterium]|nr:hypothetical protein [Myxococcaceae bacterium]MCI0670133.1 hypothetical protein [Myxococcaceae bacterium]
MTRVVVRLPPEVNLRVRLMDGDIDVRRLDGPRDVSTNTGSVLGVPLLPVAP